MRNFAWRMMGTMSMALAACGSQTASLVTEDGTTASQALSATAFQVCDSTPLTPEEPTGFNSWRNSILSSQGVYPVAQDVITLPNSDFNITSWFGMGALRVGAGNEDVVLKMDTCGAWNTLANVTTNRDGRATLQNNQLTHLGRFKVSQQMLADGAAITSTINVLPPGTHFVVFDIDGTLTTDNGQFVRQQLNSDYVPVAYPAAQAATQAWVDKGYVVLYLSGRPTDAAKQSRGWLDDLGFAKGPTHLTETPSQVVPSERGVGAFKKAYLQSLVDKGYVIDYAYGNETTDIYAYAGIGLSPEKIFILGPNAGAQGTQPLPNGYADNLAFIAGVANAGQPFSL